MQINGPTRACPRGIEFDTILGEADPIAATGIDVRIVWPALWPALLKRVCLKKDVGKCFESKTGLLSFLWVFLLVGVEVCPKHTPPGPHISVTIRIEVKVTDGALVCGARSGLLNVK
jgi:hypothetical protein